MNFLSQFDAVVKDMMVLAGGVATLRVYSEPVYVDGETTRTFEDYDINIILNDFPQANSGMKSRFGTLIESDDKEVIIQELHKANASVTAPVIHANRDVVIINNVEWKILALKEINPSGVNTILFDAHLRR